MECNKDEATRAKDMAEKKLLDGDNQGAKRLALKAQSLFPGLDGLSQFIDVINIHVASDCRINEFPNYYSILGVDPLADEDTLKKQYRRMALSLHPDKNKSVGADGAFQILSQAWSVLSDKESRNGYNLKINMLPRNQRGSAASTSAPHMDSPTSTDPTRFRPRPTASPQYHFAAPHLRYSQFTAHGVPFRQDNFSRSVPPRIPAFGVPNPSRPPRNDNMSSTRTSAPRFFSSNSAAHSHNAAVSVQSMSSANQARPNTFWTSCIWCKTHFEYRNLYLNKNLECPRCKQAFQATEISAPNLQAQGSHYWSITHNSEDLTTFLSRLRSVASKTRVEESKK
ncbi:J protein JJJ2-like [Andrographis paniculata]|uniref:J protein JJJ2-like n=1 Tax=Andrographis paniculata TaxID=175694 RepID=UPI0021E8508D|nr:J protein JJJ2-like [Andrographis paniculata]